MAKILDGKVVRDGIRETLKQEIAKFTSKPKLVIIQVGNQSASNTFIRQKQLFGESIGATVELRQFDEVVTEETLEKEITSANTDKNVHGIIVQMPLPEQIDTWKLFEMIDPIKDVDGLHSQNIKHVYADKKGGHTPGTARGIISLLDFYNIEIDGKKVVIVGRSSLVGKPTALSFLNRDATVTITHHKTLDLAKETRFADILVVAVGKKDLITKDHVSPGQTIIDVGINSIVKADGTKGLVGDVDFAGVEHIVSAISPVPGGVGPMTVASLFENLVDAYRILTSVK